MKTLGFKDVIVGHPRRLAPISQSKRKNDKVDAQKLAMLAQSKRATPVPDKASWRASTLAQAWTSLINSARGQAKAFGYRLENCDADAVEPETFRDRVKCLLETAAHITEQNEGSRRACAIAFSARGPITAYPALFGCTPSSDRRAGRPSLSFTMAE